MLAVALSRYAISTKVAKQEMVNDAQSHMPLCIIPSPIPPRPKEDISFF